MAVAPRFIMAAKSERVSSSPSQWSTPTRAESRRAIVLAMFSGAGVHFGGCARFEERRGVLADFFVDIGKAAHVLCHVADPVEGFLDLLCDKGHECFRLAP